ncbi:MAG: hypothetical protein ABJI96_18945 [Paracoccaceae bacterium]
MIEESEISEKIVAIKAELKRAFGVKAKTLEKALRKAGRLLPTHLHEKAQALVEAQEYGGNPKLLRFVDGEELAKSSDEIIAYLKDVDPRERRVGAMLDYLTGSATIVLLTAALVISVLVWKGYL